MTIGLAAVRVLVVVLSGASGEAGTRPIEDALHAALAKDATIVVRSATAPVSDEALKATALVEKASLLGVVTWDEKQRRASVRFVKPSEGPWTERDVRFQVADAPAERGRTVGFTLASMMPDEAFAPEPPPPTVAAKPVDSAPTVVFAPPIVIDRVVPEKKAPPRANPLSVDLNTLGALSSDGYGGGVGGALALRVPLSGAFGMRFGGSARFGEVAVASVTSRVFVASAGVAWQPWLDDDRRWALGARLDALVIVHRVSHLSEDDVDPNVQSRALPGIDAAVEGAYRFTDRTAVVGALGAEVALGTTDLYVHDRRVAALTPLRGLAEVGLRISF